MNDAAVLRHRTAMVRHVLSQPMSLAIRHGLVHPGSTVFDYGCGQGDDLRALTAAGIVADGWDPHFAPKQPIVEADVVNLGFVLNVIEDPKERQAALERAWSITQGGLVVAVMVLGAVPLDGLRPFNDGYLTSRGTFQRYYQQAEIRALIYRTTGVDPVALAPGIFVAFRSPEAEQEFLHRRRRGHRASTSGYLVGRPIRTREVRPELPTRIGDALATIGAFAMDRGRLPRQEEMPTSVRDQLTAERVSYARALDTCRASVLVTENFERAARDAREDLLVHHALGILNRTGSAARPHPAMARDIRTHFGSQQELARQALQYLQALADTERTVAAMAQCADGGLGTLDEDGRLLVDGSRLEHLNGVLRCFAGCAMHLAGEADDHDLARLDPLRRRMTIFQLDDAADQFPIVKASILVDLRRQTVVMRQEDRLLVRKSAVFGGVTSSQQAGAETRLAEELGFEPSRVILRRQ